MLYYAYCVSLGRPESEFFNATLGKITWFVLCATQGYDGQHAQGIRVYSQAEFFA